jgi:hypothetical protein
MPLPKIAVSTVDITIPSTQQKVKFARFRVAEEKVLLIAKQSGEFSEILTAIKQVINACAQDPLFNINKLAIFDIEYIFLKLSSASISNIAKITIFDPEDEQKREFDVDLDKVEVDDSKRKSPDIKVSDNVMIHLTYPSAALYGDKGLLGSKDPIFDMVLKCLDKIYEGEKSYDAKNFSEKELKEWIMEFSHEAYKQIEDFYENTPTLSYEIKYTNSKGTERTYKLATLGDFFSL